MGAKGSKSAFAPFNPEADREHFKTLHRERSLGRSPHDSPSTSRDLSSAGFGSTDRSVSSAPGSASPPVLPSPPYHVPDVELLFTRDPRLGLPFVDVPQEFKAGFPHLQGAVLFFFSPTHKTNRRGKEQERIVIVSNDALYVCLADGTLTRVLPLVSLETLTRIGQTGQVALFVRKDGRADFDAALRFSSVKQRDNFVDVVVKCSAFHQNAIGLRVSEALPVLNELRLEKPPNWSTTWTPLRSRSALYQSLKEAYGRSKLSPADTLTPLVFRGPVGPWEDL